MNVHTYFVYKFELKFNNFSHAPELPRFKLAPVPTTNLRLIPAETLRKKDQPISRRHSFKFVKRGFLTRNLYMSKQIYNKNSSLFLKGNCMFNISAFVRLPENSVTAGKYICNRSLIQYFQRGQFPCKYEKKHAR